MKLISMEHFLLLLLFFVLIQSVLNVSSSAAYELPSSYFIDCGSASSAKLFDQTYASDLNSSFVSESQTSFSATDQNPSSSTPLLYQSARIFTKPSSYTFQFDQNGTHLLLRLHFYPFSSSSTSQTSDLSQAVFSISVSGTTLLSNFSVPTESTVIEEFVLPIDSVMRALKVDFTPSATESSFAFVNAIEAFAAPENLIRNSSVLVSPQSDATNSYTKLQANKLRKVYRINMGGGALTPENDTLLRYWDRDDKFLRSSPAAKNGDFPSQSLVWNSMLSDEYIAPAPVYQTAKVPNVDPSRSANTFNVTWKFDVAKNSRHFVRAHFCRMGGSEVNYLPFTFFVNGYYGREINPEAYGAAVPFLEDFVVDSGDSGVMNVSIGPQSRSGKNNAFLNGLEIFQLMDAIGVDGNRNQAGKNMIWIIVCSVAGGVLILVLLLVLFFGLYHRRKSTSPNFNFGLKIPFSEVSRATNSFDESLIIGEGGFGKVYKGALQNGTKVAVKRSQPGHGQGLREFQTEIIVLSKIRHIHLVSLIGYCDERSEMILVYEFMEKGTLREHLYGDADQQFQAKFSWEQRLEICIGSAKGLHYLHTGAVDGIIHRDVKSTNILLDENYVAKVADFGLSSMLLDQKTHVTTGIKGSFGYLDPECFKTLELTDKSDVYSFGVVLLEVVCARPAITNSQNLAEWGILWQQKGQLHEIIDPFLVGKINPTSLRIFGETAAKCLQAKGVDRPKMGEVVWNLEYSLRLQKTEASQQSHNEYSSSRGASWGLPSMMMMAQRYNNQMEEHDDISSTFLSEPSASGVFSVSKIEEAG